MHNSFMIFSLFLLTLSTQIESSFTFTTPHHQQNGSVVNCYPPLNDLWHDFAGNVFSGVIEKEVYEGIYGQISFYNVSGFVFIEEGSLEFLFSGGMEMAVVLQEKGAIGFFIRDESADPGRLFMFDKDHGSLRVPVGIVGRNTWVHMMEGVQDGDAVSFWFEMDESRWYDFSGILFTNHVIWLLITSVPLTISSAKVLRFFLENPESTLAIVCLMLNWAGDLFMLIHAILDPFFFYPFSIYGVSFILPSANNALLLIISLLIVCYWAETLRPLSSKVKDFLSFLTIPFIVGSVIFAGYYLVVFFFMIFFRQDYQVFGNYFSSIVNFIMSIFFFFIGYQVIQSIPAENTKWRHMAIKIIVAGSMLLLGGATALFVGSLKLIHQWDTPLFNLIAMDIRYMEWVILSIGYSLFFHPRLQRSSSRASSKTGFQSKSKDRT